jgi:hypothetical protein
MLQLRTSFGLENAGEGRLLALLWKNASRLWGKERDTELAPVKCVDKVVEVETSVVEELAISINAVVERVMREWATHDEDPAGARVGESTAHHQLAEEATCPVVPFVKLLGRGEAKKDGLESDKNVRQATVDLLEDEKPIGAAGERGDVVSVWGVERRPGSLDCCPEAVLGWGT